MDNLFHNDKVDESLQINMDELYEQKKQTDLNKLDTYNKLLHRIHTKIKTISRKKTNEQWCWFLMPEVLIGSPNYNYADCLSYIIQQLQDNGFVVKYTHPNLIFISWKHWVPTYVRNELKKKTGIVVDGYGNKIQKKEENINTMFENKKKNTKEKQNDYKSIKSYIPSGNNVYNIDLINKMKSTLENK